MSNFFKNVFTKQTNDTVLLQSFDLSKLIKSLRTIMAYVMIFSLLWQNCLWAAGNFNLIDEDLEGCQPRIYGNQRLGIIEAGPLKNEAIHNVLEDFQLLEGSGVVFQGDPQAKAIYNRFYNNSPIQISGTIETDAPCPMVFANPGGINLENPDFLGVPHLTLVAGLMAQTDKGMAYGVDQGNVILKRTVIEEASDLKSLSLGGREICIKKSLLAPSDAISLTAGQHIKGVECVKDTVLEEGLFPVQDEHFSPRKKAIILGKTSILRSKEISILSYEEGASIYANGLLQSTHEDIVIRALGDVYIDKLVANRNLDIETTGRVFFRDKILVGGRVSVKASNISIDKEFSSVGRLFLEASQHLTLKGDVKTEDRLDISGKDLTIDKNVSAQKGSLFNLDNFTNKGLLSVFGAGLQGTIQKVINEGKIDLSVLNATFEDTLYRAGSVIRTLGHSILRGIKYRNEGTVFTCGVHQATIENAYEDLGTFYSPTLFLLKALTIKYFPTHKSYLKDGLIMASDEFIAKKGAGFYLNTDRDMYGLLLTSEGNLNFDGNIIQYSTSFPLMDYFKIFGKTILSDRDFTKEIATISLGPWHAVKKNLGIGITLAGETLNSDHVSIEEESGSVTLMANGNIQSTKTKLRSGYFKGDNASLKAKNGFLEDTILESPAGTASIIVKRIADLRKSHIWGAQHAGVYGHDVTMEKSSAKSKNGRANVFGEDKTDLTDSYVHGRFGTTVQGRHVYSNGSSVKSEEALASIYAQESANINRSHIEGKETVIKGGKKLVLTSSTLAGEYNQLTGSQIDAASVKTAGDTYFNAEEKVGIKGLKAKAKVLINGKTIVLSGDNTAHSLSAEGDYIKHTDTTQVKDNLSLKALTVEQLGKTHAKNTHIEAPQSYVDSSDSSNEAEKILSLIADNNRGFNGQQKADIAIIKLKDMNLLKLLNQTKARITEAHLKETDVNIEEDVVVNTTLHLWARNLTNKAKFTFNGDFIAHIQQTILNRGIIEGDGVSLEAQNIFAETPITRIMVPGGYTEVLQRQAAFIAHKKNLELNAHNRLEARCVNFEAKVDVTLKAGGDIYLGYQKTSSDIRTGGKHNNTHTQSSTPHKGQVKAGGNVNSWSGKNTTLEGVDTTAGVGAHYYAKGEFRDIGVNDEFQSNSSRTSKGSFGRKSTKTTQQYSSTFYANIYHAGKGGTLLESERDSHVQAPTFTGVGSATVRSNQGVAHLHAGTSVDFYDKQRTKENLVWHSQQRKGHNNETVKTVEDYTKGGFSVFGAKGIRIEIKNEGSLAYSLDQLEKNPATAWVKNLRHNPSVNWQLIEEEHKKWSKKSQGLTGPAAAVIALAIAVATSGTGAFLAGFAAASLEGAMVSAAFSTLTSKATLSIINNEGNIGKVLKDLGRKENIRDLATSVLSAGITHGVGGSLGLPSQAKGFTEQLQVNLVRSGVSAGLAVSVQGQDVREALEQAAKGVVAGTLGGRAANEIGEAYLPEDGSAPKIDPFVHKFLHAMAGAGMGAILNDDPAKGAIAGAMGAALAETIADVLSSNVEDTIKDIRTKAREEGRSLSLEQARKELETDLLIKANLGRLGAGVVSLLTGQDVDTSIKAAHNALDNNFIVAAIPVLVGAGMVAWAAYDVYDAYEQGGPKAALMQLGIEVGTAVVGGVAGKTAFKIAGKFYPSAKAAVEAVLTKNPTLRLMLGDLTQELTKYGEKITNSAAFQKVVKADAQLDRAFEAGKETVTKLISKGGAIPKATSNSTPQSVPLFDYSTPEAAYSLPIDPITRKGPMAIDSSLFTNTKPCTKLGAPKNAVQFWDLWDQKYPGMLSIENKELLSYKLSPKVDSQWIQHFPEHQNYMGQKLEHHHLDHGFLTIPLPKELHRINGNYSTWHN